MNNTQPVYKIRATSKPRQRQIAHQVAVTMQQPKLNLLVKSDITKKIISRSPQKDNLDATEHQVQGKKFTLGRQKIDHRSGRTPQQQQTALNTISLPMSSNLQKRLKKQNELNQNKKKTRPPKEHQFELGETDEQEEQFCVDVEMFNNSENRLDQTMAETASLDVDQNLRMTQLTQSSNNQAPMSKQAFTQDISLGRRQSTRIEQQQSPDLYSQCTSDVGNFKNHQRTRSAYNGSLPIRIKSEQPPNTNVAAASLTPIPITKQEKRFSTTLEDQMRNQALQTLNVELQQRSDKLVLTNQQLKNLGKDRKNLLSQARINTTLPLQSGHIGAAAVNFVSNQDIREGIRNRVLDLREKTSVLNRQKSPAFVIRRGNKSANPRTRQINQIRKAQLKQAWGLNVLGQQQEDQSKRKQSSPSPPNLTRDAGWSETGQIDRIVEPKAEFKMWLDQNTNFFQPRQNRQHSGLRQTQVPLEQTAFQKKDSLGGYLQQQNMLSQQIHGQQNLARARSSNPRRPRQLHQTLSEFQQQPLDNDKLQIDQLHQSRRTILENRRQNGQVSSSGNQQQQQQFQQLPMGINSPSQGGQRIVGNYIERLVYNIYYQNEQQEHQQLSPQAAAPHPHQQTSQRQAETELNSINQLSASSVGGKGPPPTTNQCNQEESHQTPHLIAAMVSDLPAQQPKPQPSLNTSNMPSESDGEAYQSFGQVPSRKTTGAPPQVPPLNLETLTNNSFKEIVNFIELPDDAKISEPAEMSKHSLQVDVNSSELVQSKHLEQEQSQQYSEPQSSSKQSEPQQQSKNSLISNTAPVAADEEIHQEIKESDTPVESEEIHRMKSSSEANEEIKEERSVEQKQIESEVKSIEIEDELVEPEEKQLEVEEEHLEPMVKQSEPEEAKTIPEKEIEEMVVMMPQGEEVAVSENEEQPVPEEEKGTPREGQIVVPEGQDDAPKEEQIAAKSEEAVIEEESSVPEKKFSDREEKQQSSSQEVFQESQSQEHECHINLEAISNHKVTGLELAQGVRQESSIELVKEKTTPASIAGMILANEQEESIELEQKKEQIKKDVLYQSVCVDKEKKEEWLDDERLLETEIRNIEPSTIVLESPIVDDILAEADQSKPEEPLLQQPRQQPASPQQQSELIARQATEVTQFCMEKKKIDNEIPSQKSVKKSSLKSSNLSSMKAVQDKQEQGIERAGPQDMTQMIHWMLAKMDAQTIADYKANPSEVVSKLIRNHREQNEATDLEATASVEEVADLPVSSKTSSKSRELLIHLNSIPMEQFVQKRLYNRSPTNKTSQQSKRNSAMLEESKKMTYSDLDSSRHHRLSVIKPVIQVSSLKQKSQCFEPMDKDLLETASVALDLRKSNLQHSQFFMHETQSLNIQRLEETSSDTSSSMIKSSFRSSHTGDASRNLCEPRSQLSSSQKHSSDSQKRKSSKSNSEKQEKFSDFTNLLDFIGLDKRDLQQKKKFQRDAPMGRSNLLADEEEDSGEAQYNYPTVDEQLLDSYSCSNLADLTPIKIVGYNSNKKKIHNLNQKVYHDCIRVHDLMSHSYLNVQKVPLDLIKSKSSNGAIAAKKNALRRIHTQELSPVGLANFIEMEYQDFFKTDHLNLSIKQGNSYTPKGLKEQQHSRFSKRSSFAMKKVGMMTQENFMTKSLKQKLKHSHTKRDISITSDPIQPVQAYKTAQRAKLERVIAIEKKARFVHLVKIWAAEEEQSYRRWAVPKRKNVVQNRQRRLSNAGRLASLPAHPAMQFSAASNSLLEPNRHDSSESQSKNQSALMAGSTINHQSTNMAALWTAQTPRRARGNSVQDVFVRSRGMQVSDFVDYLLESIEQNWNNFVHQQAMDNIFFFNNFSQFNEKEAFELNEQRLNEFNEEQLHNWGMSQEIKLVEIGNKKLVEEEKKSKYSGLSQLNEVDDERSDFSGQSSVDLSAVSRQGVDKVRERDGEKLHYITMRAFEARFLEIILKPQCDDKQLEKILERNKFMAKLSPEMLMLRTIQDKWMKEQYRRFRRRERKKAKVQEAKMQEAPKPAVILKSNLLKDDQLGTFLERPQIQSASINYYIFHSSPKTYISMRLYHPDYRKVFKDIWLRAFQEFQIIYAEHMITKKQKMAKSRQSRKSVRHGDQTNANRNNSPTRINVRRLTQPNISQLPMQQLLVPPNLPRLTGRIQSQKK